MSTPSQDPPHFTTDDERIVRMVRVIFSHAWVNARPDQLDPEQLQRLFYPYFNAIREFITADYVTWYMEEEIRKMVEKRRIYIAEDYEMPPHELQEIYRKRDWLLTQM